MRLLGLVFAAICIASPAAAYEAPGAKEVAVRSDIPYIRCGGATAAILPSVLSVCSNTWPKDGIIRNSGRCEQVRSMRGTGEECTSAGEGAKG